MINLSGPRMFSVVCVIEPDTDLGLVLELSLTLESRGLNYELICILDSNIDSSERVLKTLAPLPNLITLEVVARNLDDFISVGLENALGDYILEIPALTDSNLVVNALINSVMENPDVLSFQLVPTKPKIRDFILSKIASRALKVKVNTMELAPRISRRDVTEAWGERLTRNKVIRVMTQLDLFSPHLIHLNLTETLKSPRFVRICLRSVAYSSAAPLRWITYVSLFGAALSISITFLVLLIAQTNEVVPGWTTTNLQISFFAFMMLTLFGMLSEYIYQNTAATLNQRYFRVKSENVSERFTILEKFNHEDFKDKGTQ
jgi:hypothetical protein